MSPPERADADAVVGLFVNLDVDDLDRATTFYREALGFRVGRSFGPDFRELLGAAVRLYLLKKPAGSAIAPAPQAPLRSYARHWTPVHLDFLVHDLEAAITRAVSNGATLEEDITVHPYGRLALLADPFGHGFCLLELNARGYDAIAEPVAPRS